MDGDADLEETHRNQGSRNALCALPSYTSGIQEKDPPAVSRPRKIKIFATLSIVVKVIILATPHRITTA